MGKKKTKVLNDTVLGISQDPLIQRYGEANSQILQAYKGVRYDSAGNDLGHQGRNLKDISGYKVNEAYKQQNIKQQAGFSGELIKEARDNKNAILQGKTERTRTSDGLGKTNDQLHDHVKVDGEGNPIAGTGSQMKLKGNYKDVVDKLANDEKWQKYNESPVDIGSEQVKVAKEYAAKQAKKYREMAERQRKNGNLKKAKELEAKADKYDKVKENLRDSGVSNKEAVDARINPKKFVAKEMIKDSHKAGVEAAKNTIVISGAISTAQSLYSVICEDKPMEEAVRDVVVTTGKGAATGYVVGATGSAIKSMMHVSKNNVMRQLGRTNAPAMIATAMLETGKSLTSYAKGEIDEMELLEQLGEKGTGLVASSYGSAIGTAVGTMILPGVGTAAGALIGGMIGYTVSSILYRECMGALQSAKISAERRVIIEEFCAESIKQMKLYEAELKRQSETILQAREVAFENYLVQMKRSILNNEVDGFFEGANALGKAFGVDLQFKTYKEFDEFMLDDTTSLIF